MKIKISQNQIWNFPKYQNECAEIYSPGNRKQL